MFWIRDFDCSAIRTKRCILFAATRGVGGGAARGGRRPRRPGGSPAALSFAAM